MEHEHDPIRSWCAAQARSLAAAGGGRVSRRQGRSRGSSISRPTREVEDEEAVFEDEAVFECSRQMVERYALLVKEGADDVGAKAAESGVVSDEEEVDDLPSEGGGQDLDVGGGTTS